MMYEARQSKGEVPAPPRPVPLQEGIFKLDSGMMYKAMEKKGEVPTPQRIAPVQPGAFTGDDGMMFKEQIDTPRLLLAPNAVKGTKTTGQSFAGFFVDGGIQLRSLMVPKPLAKYTTPLAPAGAIAPVDTGSHCMDFALSDGSSEKKRLVIPPKVAEASETVGQSFATFTSDGGIQMVAKKISSYLDNKITAAKASPLIKILGGQALANFDSDGLQFVQIRSPAQRRLFIPPKVAEASETSGQSFATFQSDGGIQMLTKVAPRAALAAEAALRV
jgi:hypothetical protein